MPTAPAETSDATLEAQVFWLRYRKEIAALLAIALLAGISVAGWRFFQERREASSSAAFATAKTATEYKAVIDNYGDTAAAAAAYLLLADEERKSGKLADANATLQRFLDKFPRHELASTARMGMAANLDAMGKHDEAVAAYQQIATSHSGSFNAPLALLAQARILQASGRIDEARRICETVMMQYRLSYAAVEASQLLGTLKPAASPAPSVLPAPPPAPASPSSSAISTLSKP